MTTFIRGLFVAFLALFGTQNMPPEANATPSPIIIQATSTVEVQATTSAEEKISKPPQSVTVKPAVAEPVTAAVSVVQPPVVQATVTPSQDNSEFLKNMQADRDRQANLQADIAKQSLLESTECATAKYQTDTAKTGTEFGINAQNGASLAQEQTSYIAIKAKYQNACYGDPLPTPQICRYYPATNDIRCGDQASCSGVNQYGVCVN